MVAASVRVRPAQHADCGAITAMFDDFAAQHHRWRPEQFRPATIGFTAAILQTWLEQTNELHLAAEIDQMVIGYARATRFDGFASEFMFQRRGVHVYLLMVAPAARRKGAGRALFQAVEAWAAEFEAEVVGLNVSAQNATARAFYAALGYDLVNEYLIKTLRRVRRFEADP